MTNQRKGINTKTEFTDFAYSYFITDSQNTDANLANNWPIKMAQFSVMYQKYL